MSVDPRDLARLAAILGRLGSDHIGERDAAAFAAMRFLQRNLTWRDVIRTPASPPTLPAARAFPAWSQIATACLGCGKDLLTPGETAFCQAMASHTSPPSLRQTAILRALLAKVSAGGGP